MQSIMKAIQIAIGWWTALTGLPVVRYNWLQKEFTVNYAVAALVAGIVVVGVILKLIF